MEKVTNKIKPNFSWQDIDIVMLDMDGTLLDKYFDDYFWHTYVPENYSLLHDISVSEARERLLARYKKEENTLNWTDIDYWSRELGLDIPDLKNRVDCLIKVHPYVLDFLQFCKERGKGLYLVTNAHRKTMDIKLARTPIGKWFDGFICAEEVGLAKENPEFWPRLQKKIGYEPNRTIFVDDTEKVLVSAEQGGLLRDKLIFVAKSSSRLAPSYSSRYPSIEYFKELMDLASDRQ